MGKLLYSAIASLDGFIEDESGSFDWAMPPDDVHAFANELDSGVGLYLYGRRMYETMRYWDTPADELSGEPEVVQEYARTWKALDKVVFSTTLEAVTTARTRLARRFDAAAVRELVRANAKDGAISGPGLAANALRAGIVDELVLMALPVVVGGGKHWLPRDLGMRLELKEERTFASGVVALRYGLVG